MIAKTNEKERFSGNKIVGRSAEWRTKREESKKRISVPSRFLSSPFFLRRGSVLFLEHEVATA